MTLRHLLQTQGILLALIAIICLIFLLQIVLDAEFYFELTTIPVAVTEAWHTLLTGDFAAVQWGEFLTLLTSVFLHGGLDHLFGNMLFLWIFAALTAELLGQKWMLLTFLLSGIAGSICHVAMDPTNPYPCLGASGAVSGFQGIYLAMAVRWHLPDPHIWPFSRPISPTSLAALALVFIAMDFVGKTSGNLGTAYGAHFGGFVAGLLLGSFVVNMPKTALPR